MTLPENQARFVFANIPDTQTLKHIHDYEPDEDYVVFKCRYDNCDHQVITERDLPDDTT